MKMNDASAFFILEANVSIKRKGFVLYDLEKVLQRFNERPLMENSVKTPEESLHISITPKWTQSSVKKKLT